MKDFLTQFKSFTNPEYGCAPEEREISDYISFFNEQRPAYSLKYLTPRQYKEYYFQTGKIHLNLTGIFRLFCMMVF